MDLLEEIKNEYVKGNASYKELSQKFTVSYSEICKRAKEEGWVEQRKEYRNTDIETRLENITLALIQKLERAIDELDSYAVSVRIKEKSVEYDNAKKPLCERIVESEKLKFEKGLIDRGALKQLVSTLRELKGKEEEPMDIEGVQVLLSDDARELAQ